MKRENINIEDGIYDRKLLEYLLYKNNDNYFNKELLAILQKLCRADLIKEPNLGKNLLLEE